MQMGKHSALVTLFCIILLNGCKTTDNPREGGFFGGIHGVTSGAYNKRLEERQESLDRLQRMRQRLEKNRTALESDKSTKSTQLAQQQQLLDSLMTEIQKLQASVNAYRTSLTEDDQQKRELNLQLGALQEKTEALSSAGDRGMEMQQLEAERARLEEEYRLLMDLYMNLGQ